MTSEHVYLDWNATAPVHPAVIEAMRAASEVAWANPASVHGPGRRARAFVEDAREAVGALTGLDPRDVLFVSGGTEANNLALRLPFGSSAEGSGEAGAMVVSRIEHPSIVRTAEALEARGVRVRWVDPTASGAVLPERIDEAVRELGSAVRLIVLQAVNHETGVVQPIGEVAEIAKRCGALFHVDAVQAIGRLPQGTWKGADMVSVAAHKIRGPKGIGALCTRPGLKVRPLFAGGAQERGLRPGTQDPIGCAGFTIAARRAIEEGPARYEALRPLRDRLEAALVGLGPGIAINGAAPADREDRTFRAPHVTNLSFAGWRGDELCAALDLEGIAVSSGSACSAGTAEASPVLRAMVGDERASQAVRISLGEDTTDEDVDRAFVAFRKVLARQ